MKLFDELKKYCDKHGVKLQIDVFRKDKNRYELTFDYYEPEELRDIRHIIADYAKIEDDIYLAGNGRAIDICFETLDESKNSSRQIKSGVNVNVLECEKDIQKLADYLYDIGRSDLVHEIDDDFDNNPPGDETSYIRKVKTWCDWRESPLVDKLEEDEWQGYLNLINSSQQIKSSRAIKSANLFAPTTPCDVMLDNGKVAPAGCEFEVSYDRNEQGEYVLGIKVQGLGKGSIRFDSEAEAKKDGWIVSKRAIKSSPNFKKFTADEIFDFFQMEELIHTVFMDREECKNAKCGMNEFSDLMYDVLPGYLGVYTADDVREVCRRAKNPKAKAFLEAFETALENAKFVDKFYNSIKVHKKTASSRKLVNSGLFSDEFLTNKVKLTLEKCNTPLSSDCYKYTNNGRVYFYAIGLKGKSTETPSILVAYLPYSSTPQPVYFDEDVSYTGEFPNEVYVDSSFSPHIGILLTVNSNESFVYDYLASNESYNIKNLTIPRDSFAIKKYRRETPDGSRVFNYFKKVAKNKGNDKVYLRLTVSYVARHQNRPVTAHIVVDSSEPVVSFGREEVDVFEDFSITDATIQFKTSAWSSFGGDKLSRKLVKSDAASEQKLKEDLIRQGYTEEEATQIVTQRKPEEDQQTAGEESQWGM